MVLVLRTFFLSLFILSSISLSSWAQLAEPEPVLEGIDAMEAYFSPDGRWIIFQGGRMKYSDPLQVNIWEFLSDKEPIKLTQSNTSCECTFFSADQRHIVYATSEESPLKENEDDFGGYPYKYLLTKEIYISKLSGDHISNTRQITDNNSYEAETSFSPVFQNVAGFEDGTYVLFTSSRTGNLDLWIQRVFDLDENEVSDKAIQLTDTAEVQEGGAFFLPKHNNPTIVYREWKFPDPSGKQSEMEKGRVNYRPMHIHTLDLVTREDRNVTLNEVSKDNRHWAPFPHPDGKRIVYAKRDFSREDHNFDIHVLNLETGKDERITDSENFEGYPVFHPKGDLILYTIYNRQTHSMSLMRVPYKS